MAHTDLPQNVRKLIVRHIDSVQQVEILALLRDNAEREWTPAEISRNLHIGPVSCENWLERFDAAGLLERGGVGYRHADRGPHARAADDLIDWYARRRLSVLDAIYNKPSSAIQSFSDAFRVRKDD
jgi:hypothetical protein